MTTNLRSLIPSLKDKIYFNYGGQGPLPDPSLKKIINSWEKLQELGPFTNNVWPYINNINDHQFKIINTKLER